MIGAGLVLAAIGLADIVRPLVPLRHRWTAWASVALLAAVVGIVAGAWPAALAAVLSSALWVWLVPVHGRGRAGFWPAVGVALLVLVAVVLVPPSDTGEWALATPAGTVGLDQVLLAAGVALFLIESANAIVRVSLVEEGVPLERIEPGEQEESDADPAPTAPGLKGGRLIGPIERLIVFALTLAAAYPLMAAFLAAKGIVRFPEISRDSAAGNRAEYFLIGTLVSWLVGLGGAFVVWWGFAR